MGHVEHLVIEENSVNSFTYQLNEAAKNGFIAISSNIFYVVHDGEGRNRFEAIYYALMVKKINEDF